MKKKYKVRSAIIAAVLVCFSAYSDPVLWYRFNGEGSTVENIANPGTMTGTLKSIDTWATKEGFGDVNEKFPESTTPFPEGTRIVVPKTDTRYEGEVKGLNWSGAADDAGVVHMTKSQASPLISLKSFTCEVFFRLPSGIENRDGEAIFPFVTVCGNSGGQGWQFGIWDRNDGSIKRGTWALPWVNGRLADANGESLDNASTWRPDRVNISRDTWHHLAFVVDGVGDGTSATVKLILDYNEIYSSTVDNYYGFYFNGESDFPFTIGANTYRTSKKCSFMGDMAEFRISDTALEIDELLHPLMPGPVDEDTLFYLPLGENSWFGHKSNTNDNLSAWIPSSVITDWKPEWRFLDGSDTDLMDIYPPLPAVVSDAPIATVRDGVLAKTGFSNASAIKLSRYDDDGTLKPNQHAIFVPDAENALQQDDFTLEFYFKQPIPLNSSTNATATLVYANWAKICINQAGGGLLVRPYVEVGGKTGQNKYDGGSAFDVDTKSYSIRVDDNEWHHFAFVWEQATSNVVAYLDYQRICSRVIPTGLQHTGYENYGFYIGCEKVQTSQGFGGELDDIRLTRRALRPHEFITSRQKQGAAEVLFHARFEGDYSSGLGEDVVGDGVARRISGSETIGNIPEFVSRAKNSKVFSDDGMTNALENTKAVRIQGGEIYWPHNSLLEKTDLTIEFFAALNDCGHSANLFRLSPGYNPFNPNPYGDPSTPIWGIYMPLDDGVLKIWKVVTLSYTNAAQRLLLQTDADNADRGRRDRNVNAIPEMNDGIYHHWALTLELTDEGNTVWNLWCDYEKVAEAEVPGRLYTPIYGSVFEIGGTTATSAQLNGRIDEIRITAGVLTPDKFMRRGKYGFMFICR